MHISTQFGLDRRSIDSRLSRNWAGARVPLFGLLRRLGSRRTHFSSLARILTGYRWPWQPDRYMTLKITASLRNCTKTATDELAISQHIISTAPGKEGRSYVRWVQDHFMVESPHGKHLVLAFEPLREPLWMLSRRLGRTGLPLPVLKACLKMILKGLAFIHSCNIIHTGKYKSPFKLS